MTTYKVLSCDVQGNSEDGFEVNDYFLQGTIDLDDDFSDTEIIEALAAEGYIRQPKAFGVTDSDENTIYIDLSSDGLPAFELRKVD
jgi:hypothetical protein